MCHHVMTTFHCSFASSVARMRAPVKRFFFLIMWCVDREYRREEDIDIPTARTIIFIMHLKDNYGEPDSRRT